MGTASGKGNRGTREPIFGSRRRVDEDIILQVCTYLGEGGGVWIKVDEAALPPEPVVPASFQMRNFHGVANTLHVGGGVRALRPKNRRDPAAQQVAH